MLRNLPSEEIFRVNLPKPSYRTMESISGLRIVSRSSLEEQKENERKQLEKSTSAYRKLPTHLKVFRMDMLRIKQADEEFKEFFQDQKERQKREEKRLVRRQREEVTRNPREEDVVNGGSAIMKEMMIL
uniref:TPX2 domain-containing protein n=1 Tax=Caenorhabditis tropicalis TaxID=1561998 RepID=A0A1I7T2L5_9PELO